MLNRKGSGHGDAGTVFQCLWGGVRPVDKLQTGPAGEPAPAGYPAGGEDAAASAGSGAGATAPGYQEVGKKGA